MWCERGCVCVSLAGSVTQHVKPQAWATNPRSPEGIHTRSRCRRWLTLTSLDCDLSLSWVWVCRMRYAPICHSTSVLCATRTTLGHSGWWTMQNSWSAATCRVAGHGNMTQPHHPLHPTAHSKHNSRCDAPAPRPAVPCRAVYCCYLLGSAYAIPAYILSRYSRFSSFFTHKQTYLCLFHFLKVFQRPATANYSYIITIKFVLGRLAKPLTVKRLCLTGYFYFYTVCYFIFHSLPNGWSVFS